MTGLLILIILIFGLPYLWRAIRPYFFRWAQRHAENYFRSAMGMPPRDKRQSRTRQSGSNDGKSSYSAKASRRRHGSHGESVIPKEYAEDVEFTEIKTYSEQQVIGDDAGIRYSDESQVSDAEIIEIRED